MKSIQDLLAELNDEQREAVLSTEEDILVLAGAGSGKTRVLTTKIAYLISQGISPYEILALTFTNKAAEEMRERIGMMIGKEQAGGLLMGTFHSIFARILRMYAPKIGYTSRYTIYDQSDSQSLVKRLMEERGIDEKTYRPKAIAEYISRYKNEGISPRDLQMDRERQQELLSKNLLWLSDIYAEYCRRCIQANAMDFDDLLLNMYALLARDAGVREECHHRFRYILVDEYQDTNTVQDQIVRLLRGTQARVCVVGDDSQSIYSFRGAVIDNILNFSKTFPGAKLIKLTKNYRSTRTIVDLSNEIIARNTKRIPKDIEAVSGCGAKVGLFAAFTSAVEAQTIARKIQTLLSKGVPAEEIAILYRTNALSRQIEEHLRIWDIPYRIYGGPSFYDRKEVKDLLAYLRLLINPHDEEALCRIYNTPTRGIGQKSFQVLSSLAHSHSLTLWEVISTPTLYRDEIRGKAKEGILQLVTLLQECQCKADELPPDELVNYLMTRSGLRKMYSDGSVESESRLQNMEELLNTLSEEIHEAETQGRGVPTLNDFLERRALYTDTDEDTEEDNSPKVSLMTMHASKGLEFEYVFIVGLEEGIISRERSLQWGIEEERRLLYVAVTRAKTKCQLSFARKRFLYGKTSVSQPSRFLLELTPRHIDDSSGLYDSLLELRERRHHPPSSPSPSRPIPPKRYTRIIRRKDSEEEATPTAAPCTEGLSYTVGDYVYHDTFGRGLVEGFSESISGTKVHITFDDHGTKVLIAKFARLRKE